MNKETNSIIDYLQSNVIASSNKVQFIHSIETVISDEMKLSIYSHFRSHKINWAVRASILRLMLNNVKYCITSDLIIQIKSSKNWLNRLNAAKILIKHNCCKSCNKYITTKNY